MDVEGLRGLYRDDRAARVLLDRWAGRQRRASVSDVGALLRDQQLKDVLGRGDVVRIFKALESCDCGRFVAGRRGKESRFVWSVDCIRVGEVSKNGVDLSNLIPSPDPGLKVSNGGELSNPITPSGPAAVAVAPDGTREHAGTVPRMSPGDERIVVSYRDSKDHGLPKRKAFTGKWIIRPEEPVRYPDESGRGECCYSVAITGKKNIVVYAWDQSGDGRRYEYFWVFDSLDQAAAADEMLSAAIAEAIERMGVEVEELDI
jgi:hypothetical protein